MSPAEARLSLINLTKLEKIKHGIVASPKELEGNVLVTYKTLAQNASTDSAIARVAKPLLCHSKECTKVVMDTLCCLPDVSILKARALKSVLRKDPKVFQKVASGEVSIFTADEIVRSQRKVKTLNRLGVKGFKLWVAKQKEEKLQNRASRPRKTLTKT